MKKLIICRIALSFLPCWATIPNSAQAEEDLVNLIKNVKPAVVLVQIFNAAGLPIGQGSGFFIDNKGHVVTNHHVIKGAYSATVKTSAGKEFPVEGIIAKDSQADIAKLAVNIADSNIVPLKLSTSIPSEGETVVVIGSPLGLEASVSSGIVSAVRDIPAFGKVLQITAPVSPGSSGSPVMNTKGEVIGVATFILTKGQNLNFAVSSEKVLALKETCTILSFKEYAAQTSKTDPNDPELLYQAGLKEVWQGNYDSALIYFQKATAKNPQYTDAWFYVGACYAQLRQFRKAAEIFEKIVKIKPDWAPGHYNLGFTYHHLGRYREAIESFKEAIQIKPDDASSRHALSNTYLSIGQLMEALDAAKDATIITPDDPRAHVDLGIVYNRLTRYQDAIEACKKAIRIKPDYVDAYFEVGNSYYGLGQCQEAVEVLKQAIKIKPDSAAAHYNLGTMYIRCGDLASAEDQYKILEKINVTLAIFLRSLIDQQKSKP